MCEWCVRIKTVIYDWFIACSVDSFVRNYMAPVCLGCMSLNDVRSGYNPECYLHMFGRKMSLRI